MSTRQCNPICRVNKEDPLELLAKVSELQLHEIGRQWHPTPVLLPGKSHGRRSLVGCRLWGRTESDMTEAT